jgi:hypothetical protein
MFPRDGRCMTCSFDADVGLKGIIGKCLFHQTVTVAMYVLLNGHWCRKNPKKLQRISFCTTLQGADLLTGYLGRPTSVQNEIPLSCK